MIDHYVMTDSLNNEVYAGDEVFVLVEETFLIDSLSWDAQKILEILGAERLTI